ncbi:MAG: peptidase M14, partial [Saprospiraceae bacterium]|nr:peptidase M14 [Saprospiraceae bacterium]
SPVNPNIHPGVTTGVNLVGTAMANYFAMKKMPGVISGTNFSMWWNGGVRTAPYYHNQIGILTETAHSTPTPRFYPPDSVPKNVAGTSANGTEIFYPYPWKGGESHFRGAVEYMINASMGILNIAADRKNDFLYNIYDMGRDAIETPIAEGAYAYVIPQQQWDTGETINLINILQQGGVQVHEASSNFQVGDMTFNQGDFVLYGAQSFRPYLTDLLEKQSYPDQFRYPGGPPVPPYDLAGWTLPMQMGIEVHRIDTVFNTSTKLLAGKPSRPAGEVNGEAGWGYVLSNQENLSALAVNRLQKEGHKVHIAMSGSESILPGYFLVEANDGVRQNLDKIASETGLNFTGLSAEPSIKMSELSPIKLGIYKSWRANMDEGWTRWVLEQFEFDLDTLHNMDIIEGDLSGYDAIIIPSQSTSRIMNGYPENFMPPKFTGGLGLYGTIALHEYAKKGGVLIAFDQASDYLINQFSLPVRNVTSGASSSSFFIPGSLVRIKVDTTEQLGFGMNSETAASFSRSRAFKRVIKSRKGEGGTEDIQRPPEPDVNTVVKYADKDILMSGWARGEDRYLKNNGALMDVKVGKGHAILFGFRPQFRGQPRGTYKLIFNAIYLGAMEDQDSRSSSSK